jgi:hypothetical protein
MGGCRQEILGEAAEVLRNFSVVRKQLSFEAIQENSSKRTISREFSAPWL